MLGNPNVVKVRNCEERQRTKGWSEVVALERLGESSVPQSSAVSAMGEKAVNEGHVPRASGMLSNSYVPAIYEYFGIYVHATIECHN